MQAAQEPAASSEELGAVEFRDDDDQVTSQVPPNIPRFDFAL